MESIDSFFEVLYANLPSSPSQDTESYESRAFLFLGRAYAWPRSHEMWCSLCGLQPLRKSPTIENLRWRHILIVDWFCRCKSSGESIDHLFLHCPMVLDIWSAVYLLVWANLGDAKIYGWGVGVLARTISATQSKGAANFAFMSHLEFVVCKTQVGLRWS